MTAHLARTIIGTLLAIGVHNPAPRWCNASRTACTATGDVAYQVLGGPVHCTMHLTYNRRMTLRFAMVGAGDCVPTTKDRLVDMSAKRRGPKGT